MMSRFFTDATFSWVSAGYTKMCELLTMSVSTVYSNSLCAEYILVSFMLSWLKKKAVYGAAAVARVV